jgi:hypothetical protein
MAEAGFYLIASAAEPDLVRCYYCRRELDGWEPDDVPWEEHKRRPCSFIQVVRNSLTVKLVLRILLPHDNTLFHSKSAGQAKPIKLSRSVYKFKSGETALKTHVFAHSTRLNLKSLNNFY